MFHVNSTIEYFYSLVDFPQDSAVKFADCPTTSNLIRKDSNNVKVKNQTELLRKASTNTAPIISNKVLLASCFIVTLDSVKAKFIKNKT